MTSAMHTCTWAPTVFTGMQLDRGAATPRREPPRGPALIDFVRAFAERLESLGIDHLLIAQRWWGSGEEMEGSSHDALAMTTLFAQHTRTTQLITAIHPGFFSPTVIAKWGATMDAISDGRWAINVTSGWHMHEFAMYGVDPLEHDERYARSAEFIRVLRGAWTSPEFDFDGRFYQARGLHLEPRPRAPLQVYQGGQSAAAIALAAQHSDWMFVNGAPLDRVSELVARTREACRASGRQVRFAMHANPLVRATDAAAWAEIDTRLAALDPARVAARRASVRSGKAAGDTGMWASDDELAMLDTNEGFAARLIGAPDSVFEGIRAFRDAGIDMLHLTLADPMFIAEVLPQVHAL